MHLDPSTVLVAGCATLILQGALLVFSWLRDRQAPWLLWWGVPFLLTGAAILFYVQPGWETSFTAIAFGNASRLLAVGGLWQGLRQFNGRRLVIWPVLTVSFGWVALCFVPGIVDSMLVRVSIVSVINATLCGAAAWELTSGRTEALPSRRPLMLVFASFATIMVARVAAAPFAPFPVGAHPAEPAWVAGFVFLVFVHVAFAAQLFFSLTRERREAQQRRFALSDQLTGLMNRRAFSDYAEPTAGPRSEFDAATALLVLDLDHFKSVNDRHGHEAGDRLLQAFAEVARASVRPTDQLFRMGGEEFCFVLPGASAKEAVAIAERIRLAFEASSVETNYGYARTTVSIGIAASELPLAIDVLLSTADAAVYEAKARGRNRVVLADPAALADVVRVGAALTRRRAS